MLDKKDKMILNLLQRDSRMSLTRIAKEIGLSIDSTHKRIKKMQKDEIFFQTISIDPRKLGYNLTVDVKVKLHNFDRVRYDEFIKYLCRNPFVMSVFSVSGDYDLTIPLIAMDHEHLDKISLEIRNKFKDIIADWRGAVNLKIHKYEEFDMSKL